MFKLLKYSYFIILIFLLFYRSKDVREPNFDVYLLEWLPYVFKNKTVFINVIGNIILFIPLGCYKGLLKGLQIVLIFEILQYYLQRGVFDVVDIILNGIGIFVGSVVRWTMREA